MFDVPQIIGQSENIKSKGHPMNPPAKSAITELTPTGKLRVGLNMSNFLLTAKDAAGAPIGVAPDLGGELGKRLGVAVDAKGIRIAVPERSAYELWLTRNINPSSTRCFAPACATWRHRS